MTPTTVWAGVVVAAVLTAGCGQLPLATDATTTTESPAASSNGGGIGKKLRALDIDNSPNPQPPYDREAAFGGWASIDGCDTRARLLADTSEVGVVTNDYCTVQSGLWDDPYTEGKQTISDPAGVDAEHVVPAQFAYDHGLWEATPEQRAEFYNDRSNLWAVSASENRSKGAAGPSEWWPTNPDISCKYVKTWVRVATDYDLTVTAADHDTLTAAWAMC